jgi:hypothetical protein
VKGWIVNVSRDDATHEVERAHEPTIVLDTGEPVFEVWFWHHVTQRWFVMTKGPHDPRAVAQGVVYFHPNDVPHALRARVDLLRKLPTAA